MKILRKLGIICFLMVNLSAVSENSIFPDDMEAEEALFLRRIVEFWQEGEKVLVKKEIEKYLNEKDSTPLFDSLYAFLGEIYIEEKNYDKAIENYKKITNKDVKEQIFINYIQALYEEKRYEDLLEKEKDVPNFLNSSDRDIYYFLIADSYLKKASFSEKQEDKINFAKKAEEYFEKFEDKEKFLEALAETQDILKNYEQSAKYYLRLAEKNVDKKEIFLFKAALAFSQFDKEKSIDTFSRVIFIGKEKVQEASFNKMILLIEEKKFRDFILAREQLESNLNEKNKRLLNFLVGKSYFELKDYKKAKEYLKNFLEKKDNGKKALCSLDMLIVCAEEEKEEALFDYIIEKYEKNFSKEKNLPKIYFARALFYKKSGDFNKAKKDFETIEKNFTDFTNQDYMLETALFYYEREDYLTSRIKFKQFIDKYSDHKDILLCWQYLINSSLKMMDHIKEDQIVEAKNVLIKDIENYLQKTENKDLRIHLAKLKYENKDYDSALLELQIVFDKYKKAENDPEANLILSLCYKYKGELEKFCFFAEKALAFDIKNNLDILNIRLNLFNVYLDLSEKNKELSKNYLEKASEHLFSIHRLKKEIISLENIIWLGNYYYSKVKGYMEERWDADLDEKGEINDLCNRAISVLEDLKDDYQKNKVEAFFQLADLYGYKKEFEKKKNFLEDFIKKIFISKTQKGFNKKEKTNLLEKVYFELAMLFQKLNEREDAIKYFEKIIHLNKHSYYEKASILYLSRLDLLKIAKKDLNLNNSKVIKILSNLKNLKLNKNLKDEPIHLEAALDYIDLQYKIDKNEEKKLKLLIGVKEDFLSDKDLISKDYQLSKDLYPKKAKLVKAYLSFIDAEIDYTLAKLGKSDINKVENLYKDMISNNQVVSPYINKQIQKKLSNICLKKDENKKL
ncbi:MAG: hypothetical protein AMS24_02965 [Chlamydiae bacterium SM23_39]|nr:MAG: hypothetical protein AMS24_02965 [Chlamydiae bacterium SM23_39]